LELSTEHRGLLMSSHISLVFHIAASVRFQYKLLETMQINAWPGTEVVRLSSNSDVKVKKSGSVCAPNTFVNVHIFSVCGVSYPLIHGARLYAD